MLWRAEGKKLLVIRRGLLLLALCLGLKALFLGVFPEQKDVRIQLSQTQYDKYLERLQGENTPEKSAWILEDYAHCLDVIGQREEMERRYAQGELSQETWENYQEELNQAYLHQNAAQIFAEAAERFAQQPAGLPPAHFLYEYGWRTIFSLHRWPDVLLLSWLLLLGAQCFPVETASGMLPVLLAARNGRERLFFAKLGALAAAGLGGTVLSALVETAVFLLRGWCNDAAAPVYSVQGMDGCWAELSLGQGYLLSLALRSAAALLFAVGVFALSQWLKNSAYLLFAGICLLALPLLWDGAPTLFLYGGLSCGTRALLWMDTLPLWLPLGGMILYTGGLVFLAARRFRRGL